MKANDLLLDATYDLAIGPGGDLLVGESDAQHLDLLLQTFPGEWRADPLVGIGLVRYLNSPYGPAQAAAFGREVTIQLVRDGYRVLALNVADLVAITLNAERP
jgi:hypothetical protein